MEKSRICKIGLWDETVPGIKFDENGVSNYARLHQKLSELYPRGQEGNDYWKKTVEKIKIQGKGKKYDCIIGVSGGTDSCYLLHLAKVEFGLRPLAVNIDNGWSSDIAVSNIKKITDALEIDLETYVIDYNEVRITLRAYMKAGLPWIDAPTDLAIKTMLFRSASRENIKYILNGSDFRSEGKQPIEWTYSDSYQLKYLVKKFEGRVLKNFPCMSIIELVYHSFIRGIVPLRPLNSLEYDKTSAQSLLKLKYNWQYYGGHHFENIFTKYAISYWMPKKFGIDKRIISLSAQVLSNQILRDDALRILETKPYNIEASERDSKYIAKKLELSKSELEFIWNSPNKFFYDYPSYQPYLDKLKFITRPFFKSVYKFEPTFFIERDQR